MSRESQGRGKETRARVKWRLRLLRVLELLVKEHRRILVVPFPINKFNYLIRLRRRNFNRFLRFAPVLSCESKNGGLGRNDRNNGGATPTIGFWLFVTDYLGKFEGQNTGYRRQKPNLWILLQHGQASPLGTSCLTYRIRIFIQLPSEIYNIEKAYFLRLF